ncbi:hypothetical protein [Streptomyces aureus]|uniref:hypothetical protein n=1 Tax=Streptomyces aureus TaxID=193461 RepID=UPI003403FF4D
MTALLITVVWAIAAAPEPPCTDAVPCGADWTGMAEIGLALGLLYWLARLPEMTLIAAPALAAVVAPVELPHAEPNSLAANLGVLAALGFGWAAAFERLAARRRQRDLAASTAGVRHPLPGPVGPLRRGLIPVVAGLLLVGAAVFCAVEGLVGVHEDGRHADRAVPVVAKVTGRGDESIRVRTGDGRRLTLGSAFPEDHRVGSRVTVLEDGSWRRLASEPYDAMGPQLGVLAAGLPGLSLLATGLLSRRRAAALRRGPVPARRVLARMDGAGRIWIHAGDDTACRRPLLTASFVAEAPPGGNGPERDAADGPERDAADGPEWKIGSGPGWKTADGPGWKTADGPEREAWDGAKRKAGNEDGLFAAAMLPREAVLFGAPHEGGELLLVTTFRDDEPAVLRTSGPVRPAGAGGRPYVTAEAEECTAAEDAHAGAAPVPATLVTTGRPLRWGPGVPARAGGAAMALAMILGSASTARSMVTDGIGVQDVFFLFCLLSWSGIAGQLLDWRVTADSSGVWLGGGWNVRHVPWDRLRRVRYTRDGNVETRLPDGTEWRLPGLGMPRLERRFGLHPARVRMAAELNALRDDPELRPVEAASRRDRGLPLGPVLLALTVVVAVAWALH